jgi:DNA-binding transcriptional MerR regulator
MGSLSTRLPVKQTQAILQVCFNGEEAEQFRARWNQIQGKFVDEPRIAVRQADALTSEIIEKITLMFAEQKDLLENQWKQGNEVSTEEMRKTLQNYRSFFNILVT